MKPQKQLKGADKLTDSLIMATNNRGRYRA